MNRITGYLIVAAMLVQCANPVTPTGGAKDVQAPVIIKTDPIAKTKNIKPSKITFYFNENIVVENAKEQIVLSPKTSLKPKITTTKNTIVVDLDGVVLNNNTSYSLQLNESVKDLNEGNKGTYPALLFGTGETLDSFNINGKILFINEPKTSKLKAFVDAENKYQTVVSKNKTFTIQGLMKDTFDVVVYNDINNNDSLDIYEDAGLESLNTTDSGLVVIYNREPKKVGLYKYADNWFGLSSLNKNLIDKENLIFNKDTLLGDSQTIYSIINELPKKYYSVSKTPETKKSTFHYTFYKPAYLSDSIPQVFITSNQLIGNYRSIDNVIQTKDSINIGVTSVKNNNQIKILFPVKPKGRILFPVNIDNAEGRPIRDTVKTTIPEYTELLLINKEKDPVTIVLTHKNTTESYIQTIESGKNLALWALAGEHTLELWMDTDQDKHITAPDFASKRKGERYKKHKSIVLKDGMTLEIGLKMGISE